MIKKPFTADYIVDLDMSFHSKFIACWDFENHMNTWLLVIFLGVLLAPIICALIVLLFGRWVGKAGLFRIVTGFFGYSWILLVVGLWFFLDQNLIFVKTIFVFFPFYDHVDSIHKSVAPLLVEYAEKPFTWALEGFYRFGGQPWRYIEDAFIINPNRIFGVVDEYTPGGPYDLLYLYETEEDSPFQSYVYAKSFFRTLLSWEIDLGTWFRVYNTEVNFVFLVDGLTLVMLSVVLGISTIVHLYAFDYLRTDPHIIRFIFILNLFTFFMGVFVAAGDLLVMFVGWEGIGICSYLLITFWYTRLQANKAALKALVVNRIGDICILLAMSLFWTLTGTLNYVELSSLTNLAQFKDVTNFNIFVLEGACFFLLLGAFGKSAQFGFHVWLPDAMEGPTPVSALLHAATMVTAGVFLVIRFSFLFLYFPNLLGLMTVFGALTALVAASTAVFQYDIKKIIAFSTCTHLGYMFFACGVGQPLLAFFHLFNHAFFKALLFLAAGSVIHALNDEQDLRKMGGLSQVLPQTFTFFIIGSLSGIGFPYLAGYYSKDLIVEFAFLKLGVASNFLLIVILLTVLLSSLYSFRLIYYVFGGTFNGYRLTYKLAAEAVDYVQYLLIGLTFLSIVSGYFFFDFFVGFNDSILILGLNGPFVYPVGSFLFGELEMLNQGYRWFILMLVFIGLLFAGFLDEFLFFSLLKKQWGVLSVARFFNQGWYFNIFYNIFATYLVRQFYYFYFYFDKGLLEAFGPTGLREGLTHISQFFLQKTQTGYLPFYLVLAFTGVLIFYLYVIFNLFFDVSLIFFY